MNDPSQTQYHKEKVALLDCEIDHINGGYQALCPRCPWTSGIKEIEELAKKTYYRHIAYIMNKLGE